MNRLDRWSTFLLLLLLQVLVLASPCRGQAQSEVPPAALVIELAGPIASPTVALVNRAVREARSLGVGFLVLEISSPGGALDAMRSIQDRLTSLRDDIATVAYVDESAFSAAAMIALSCDQLFMRPHSAIGAATPVQMNPLTGEIQDIPDDARRKAIGAMKALMRSTVQGSERNSESVILLVEAMIDPAMHLWEVTYKDASGLEQTKVVLEETLATMRDDPDVSFVVDPTEFTSRPLSLSNDEAQNLGISDGTEDTLEMMIKDRLHLEMSQVGRLKETWSEDFVTLLNDMRPVLFVLGFILLLIEFKTPGFALPGILGVIMFGLAFFGSYMVGLADISEILLFFIGIGLLATEIFFFPGTVFFALAGFVCIVSGLILSQQSFVIPATDAQSDLMVTNFTNFGLILVFVMLGTWAIYANIHRIPILRLAVQTPPDVHPEGTGVADALHDRLAQLRDRIGAVVSALRPAGVMDIDGERFDVVSEGSFVPKGSAVRVIEVRGNRIVVEAVRDGDETDQGSSESGEVGLGFLAMLVLIGLALVVAEVFFVSFGVLAIISGVSLVTAVFLAFAQHGTGWGLVFLSVCAVGVPMAVKYAFTVLPNLPFGRQLYLDGNKHEEVTGGAQQVGLDALLTKTGIALCDLRPSGFAEIGGRRVDVITRGEMLEKDSPLKVVKVESNQVFVALDQPSN